MRLHLTTKRPASWSETRNRIKHQWTTPFFALEWIWEWSAHLLSNWMFLRVLDYVRSFGVILAVTFYFAESGDRVKQRHYQAWQVIDTAQGKGGNGGRIDALQELNEDGISLVGIDMMDAFLQGLHLEKAHLARSNFGSADVRNAVLIASDMSNANLQSANLRECNCTAVSFRGANLDGADLWGANLRGVDLNNAILTNTDLRNTDLHGISWKEIRTVKMANVAGVRNAPEGFMAWALSNGAVQSTTDPD